jgi:hypothetical protein
MKAVANHTTYRRPLLGVLGLFLARGCVNQFPNVSLADGRYNKGTTHGIAGR